MYTLAACAQDQKLKHVMSCQSMSDRAICRCGKEGSKKNLIRESSGPGFLRFSGFETVSAVSINSIVGFPGLSVSRSADTLRPEADL